jgi:hypothetical protein
MQASECPRNSEPTRRGCGRLEAMLALVLGATCVAQSDDSFGCLVVLAVGGAFLVFSNYDWSNSLWYSVEYGVDFGDVQTDAKPNDCDFMFHQNRTVSWLISIPRSAELDVAQRQRGLHVHHHDQTDHCWRTVEIPERVAHGLRLPRPRMGREIALTMSFRDYPPALGGCPACQWTATNI